MAQEITVAKLPEGEPAVSFDPRSRQEATTQPDTGTVEDSVAISAYIRAYDGSAISVAVEVRGEGEEREHYLIAHIGTGIRCAVLFLNGSSAGRLVNALQAAMESKREFERHEPL